MCNEDKFCPVLIVKRINQMGDYNFALIPGHPNANAHNYVPYHRLVMENYIGRYLNKDEVVHHKDGNKNNNDISNLELMKNSEHSKEHNRYKMHIMVEFQCPMCGKISYKRKHDTFLSKGIKNKPKSGLLFCSRKCSSKYQFLSDEEKADILNGMNDNIISFYYEYNDQSLNDY